MTYAARLPAIGTGRKDEPDDALTLCWAGCVAGDRERDATAGAAFASDGLPYASRRNRAPLVRAQEVEDA